jgi:hypothetical protein
MKLKAKNSTFEPCPEYTGRAVCVDVTPLRKQQSQYGERDVFKVVFEVDRQKEDGMRYAVWSRNFTPTLNEKSSFRKFLRGWFGRDLTSTELQEFDTETLLGKPAQLVVVHEHRDNDLFANIAACTPDKSGDALKPSGKFIRAKDRTQETGDGSQEGAGGSPNGYRRAEQNGGNGAVDHGAVKVHVGKYAGIELRDLNLEAVQALCDKWLPGAKANAKPTADDKRLIAALDWWKQQQAKENDDLDY